MDMNEELVKQLREYENAEKQLQSILIQVNQLKLQLSEIDLATKSLDGAKDDVYRSVGSIMIKTTKEDALKDLNSKKEMFEVRLASLERQQKDLSGKVNEMRAELEQKMGNGGQGK